MPSTNLPPITWLRAFEASARLLSFTLAAEELHLTQSAISQHVRRLENFLGRELFIRKVRSLELTEAGVNYLAIVKEAFQILAEGTRNFTNADSRQSIIVQCNLGFATFWLTQRIQRFHQQHPNAVLNMVTLTWNPERHAESNYIEIRFGRKKDMPPSAELLMSDQYYPVCHPDYLIEHTQLSDMSLYDCSGVNSNWHSWAKDNGINMPKDYSVHLASTYAITMTAAINGSCIAMSHDTLAQDLIREGKLIRPFAEQSDMEEGYYLIKPPHLDQNHMSKHFCDWLVEEVTLFKQRQAELSEAL